MKQTRGGRGLSGLARSFTAVEEEAETGMRGGLQGGEWSNDRQRRLAARREHTQRLDVATHDEDTNVQKHTGGWLGDVSATHPPIAEQGDHGRQEHVQLQLNMRDAHRSEQDGGIDRTQ